MDQTATLQKRKSMKSKSRNMPLKERLIKKPEKRRGKKRPSK